jgi:FKBP-type peptidyl-prolyl cis-trans isomerase
MSEELIIEEITVGNGQEVKSGNSVVAHYHGMLMDGSVFDSSRDRGEPFEATIGIGMLIQGWDKGIPGMKVGGRRKLTIPAHLAYGDRDIPGIPGGSTLIFEVDILDIK